MENVATSENKSNGKRALGICLGASTISVTQIEIPANSDSPSSPVSNIPPKILDYKLFTHSGNPKNTLLEVFENIDPEKFDHIAVTGRRFHKFVDLSSISEPEAVEYAYRYLRPNGDNCRAVVSAGGETFIVYELDKKGKIANVYTGNKCASGTGEFFLQQLRRMNVSLDEFATWTNTDKPYHVSGRCSVFCKSDCTHATNKGIPKFRVTSGLCTMMANKILELLKKVDEGDIMLTGGTTRNHIMIDLLKQQIPGVDVPEQAPYFEALGAALWASKHKTKRFISKNKLFKTDVKSFEYLRPLKNYSDLVTFKNVSRDKVTAGDTCILGLDVGSTTTKAVLLRKSDNTILASVYLRTNGDPVGASRKCYGAILKQIASTADPNTVDIIGIGVCGSGRQIAGLHALTNGVVNEIVAHAKAAVHFDPKVDTIFEIGGQDAKYTYITNSVPSDYAMNEACSAGTGSFLEESALESLNIKMEDIAEIALKGQNPPNFNDQCAAFISSDIKNAIHEDILPEDIVAGLVYSICMNYTNRVKGSRTIGEKIFMQGGVCYNKAVPLAMAALVGKPIIVPPDPGLMGAFGVALEIKERIDTGLMQPETYNLQVLVDREIHYGRSFICKGAKQQCDRRCKISVLKIENRKFPFGGACNRYYNIRHQIKHDSTKFNLVRFRQDLVFDTPETVTDIKGNPRPTVGINRSFLTNTYFPLYVNFFHEIGFDVIVPNQSIQTGIDMKEAAFCHPVELTHGFFYDLLIRENPPDYLFMPHFKAVPTLEPTTNSQVCPLIQGEPSYLKTTFANLLKPYLKKQSAILSPLIDLSTELSAAYKPLVETAFKMGVHERIASEAFSIALRKQNDIEAEMKARGKTLLETLAENPEQIAVVIFSRPYNGMVREANMGIPDKLASRGIFVVPFDFLPTETEKIKKHMYWGMGQRILQAAQFVKRHPQLFGTFITNFSCGPDSFLIGYFREIMGKKPSLTLELDSHTADAGLETRIEAFLDVIASYQKLIRKKQIVHIQNTFTPAKLFSENGNVKVMSSCKEVYDIKDPRVKLIIPSMGRLTSEIFVKSWRAEGYNAICHPPADENILKLGRANTSGKECLPLILTTGTMLNYIYNERDDNSVVIYFMPTASGPCRFGQYHVFMSDLVKRLKIKDVALFSALTSDDDYSGLSKTLQMRIWWGIIISDCMEDIRSMLLTNADNPESALDLFEEEWQSILACQEKGTYKQIEKQLAKTAKRLANIPLKQPCQRVPTILMSGEFFVRRDGLSRRFLTEYFAQKGFAVVCSPIAEWFHYINIMVDIGSIKAMRSIKNKLDTAFRHGILSFYDKRLKSILTRSGLIKNEPVHVRELVQNAAPYLSPDLTGEAILTIGSAVTEIASNVCGVIAIGPFGCMPNRLAEAILNKAMHFPVQLATNSHNEKLQQLLNTNANDLDLPFLAIESDGAPFPQLVHAKLETFCLRAERLHQKMVH